MAGLDRLPAYWLHWVDSGTYFATLWGQFLTFVCFRRLLFFGTPGWLSGSSNSDWAQGCRLSDGFAFRLCSHQRVPLLLILFFLCCYWSLHLFLLIFVVIRDIFLFGNVNFGGSDFDGFFWPHLVWASLGACCCCCCYQRAQVGTGSFFFPFFFFFF